MKKKKKSTAQKKSGNQRILVCIDLSLIRYCDSNVPTEPLSALSLALPCFVLVVQCFGDNHLDSNTCAVVVLMPRNASAKAMSVSALLSDQLRFGIQQHPT